uniref:Retroviral polymerase SH3-like domain-containing protein n=1 Tax=Physcomitrium patens TaxID=3218 RepID=A0A2K1K6N1_PHYPA|nr:hypothetical protein PHYPA_011332 [Physcomitrium patens]
MVNIENYLIIKGPTRTNRGETPKERWTKKKLEVHYLRIIRSLICVHVPKEEKSKFQSKTLKHIMLGYDERNKVYKLYDL